MAEPMGPRRPQTPMPGPFFDASTMTTGFLVTAKEMQLPWAGRKDGSHFRCFLCGHRFQVGDIARFQFIPQSLNIMVCTDCDGPDLVERWMLHYQDGRTRFWWMEKLFAS